jgi:HK97 family phage prohead protease
MSFTTRHIPDVSTLHPAHSGEGLILTGYASTWSEDRALDQIHPHALDDAVKQYMSTNPVLLWSHKMSLPAIGKVLKAVIHRERGVWIEAFMPRPPDGSFAAEVYNAAKTGLVKAFSLGASWLRSHRKGYPEIIGADLREISLASCGVNGETLADSVTPTQVKCVGDAYVPLAVADEYKAIMDERDGLYALAGHLQRRADVNSRIAADLAAHRELRAAASDVAFTVAKLRVRELLR